MKGQSIGIIGAGKLGADVAFMLAERDVAEVVLYDRDRDRAAFLASDLTETVFGGGYNNRIVAVESMGDLTRCDVVLLAAGERGERESGESISTAGHFSANRPLVREVAETFTGTSTLFVVASEPVDLLTAELTQLLRLPFSRVLGLGGVLDAHRVRHLLSEAMQFNPEYLRSQVVGPHDERVIPLWDYTSINGVPVRSILDRSVLSAVESALSERSGGAVPRGSSSRYTPAVACVDLLDAILRDDRRILSATVLWDNVYGLSGIAMGLPCLIGRLGAERIILPELSAAERKRLTEAAGVYEQILKGAQA